MSEFTRSVAAEKARMNEGIGPDDLDIRQACAYVNSVWSWFGTNHPISATIKLAEPSELQRLASYSAGNQLHINEALRMAEVENA